MSNEPLQPSWHGAKPSEPGFRCIVAGDTRLQDQHYPFLCSKLDRLLRRYLPNNILLIHAWRQYGTDRLVTLYRVERRLRTWNFQPGHTQHMIDRSLAVAAVVFDGGDRNSADVILRARAAGLQLRVVNVRQRV